MNKIKINQNDLKSFLEERKNSDKGILLMGNTGVGKTYSMENFYLPPRRKGHEVDALEIFEKANKLGLDFVKEYLYHNMFIDDLGFEPKLANHFGTVFCPMEILIQERYKIFPQYKTHFTTNLNMKEDEDGEILSKYGPRTLSRLKGMCDLIIVEGNDLRNL
jgi:DNA replication protein DnaC